MTTSGDGSPSAHAFRAALAGPGRLVWTGADRDEAILRTAAEPFECIVCRAPCEPRAGEDPVTITCPEHRQTTERGE